MPELAAAFAIGSLVSLLLGTLFTYLQVSKYTSNDYRTLQTNLSKIDLRWNDLEANVLPKQDVESDRKLVREEYKKALTTYLLFTAFAVLFSWVGAFFLILMWVSVKKLIKSRLEKALFNSELIEADLPKDLVIKNWQMLKDI